LPFKQKKDRPACAETILNNTLSGARNNITNLFPHDVSGVRAASQLHVQVLVAFADVFVQNDKAFTQFFADELRVNLSGFYNTETKSFEYVDSLSVVWTSDGFATVISPNNYTEEEKEWTAAAMKFGRMKPNYLYPVRCIRIDDPHHKMDDAQSDMVTYYNNMRMLPYLFR